jgi:PQQ-dependent catabolism-associated CXXCW motif protein
MNRPSLLSLVIIATVGIAPVVVAQDSFGPPQQPQQQPRQQQPSQQQQSPQQYPQQQPQYPQQQQQPQYPQPNQPPQNPGQQQGSEQIARMVQMERQDMGVQPTAQLRSGGMHGPTPASIPGGRLVTTPEVAQLLGNPQSQALVFDVLGGPQMLPNAIPVVPAAQGGTFQDQTQQEFGNYLQQVTQGRKDRPMIFYCQSVQCWMSYNAALRAINLGYTSVLWYRGGIEAWEQAGLPLANPGGQMQGGQQPQDGPPRQ